MTVVGQVGEPEPRIAMVRMWWEGEPTLECVAVIACSAGLIFARLAHAQELNPFLWGFLGIAVYAAAPGYMIWRGAGWMDAAWVWLSSFVGLFVLFVVQTIVAAIKRQRSRAPAKQRRAGR